MVTILHERPEDANVIRLVLEEAFRRIPGAQYLF